MEKDGSSAECGYTDRSSSRPHTCGSENQKRNRRCEAVHVAQDGQDRTVAETRSGGPRLSSRPGPPNGEKKDGSSAECGYIDQSSSRPHTCGSENQKRNRRSEAVHVAHDGQDGLLQKLGAAARDRGLTPPSGKKKTDLRQCGYIDRSSSRPYPRGSENQKRNRRCEAVHVAQDGQDRTVAETRSGGPR
ncbi:hypothetical protein NDU88_004674 [Pleurodeles waltl]|uniref:Uncharacterized protein n=1 Tax=Pleurodeles waltl TaxID=8319 RepID=A0AAV7UG13_PLEWA|nr:hypothetical protein NDU88_004674 [Pleurodeles waltl]